MSIATKLLTATQFEQMDFEHATELVRGEIVEQPMPNDIHGVVCVTIVLLLGAWKRERRCGHLMSNDTYVVTERNPDSVRGPDITYVGYDRLPAGGLIGRAVQVPPHLAIEVLSPSNRRDDMDDKVAEYLRSGIDEVWVVDPETRTVDVHPTGQPSFRLTETDTLERPHLLPDFSTPVAELFADLV